jgi:ATP-dependent DNA helicase PIF1
MVKVFDQYVPIQLPVVQFHNGYKTALPPKVWQSSTDPTIAVSQIPLVPCWAMTIHKAQGATLDAAEMDVGNDIFECGQAYVALSRVKTLDGLFLRSFNAQKIRANPMVKAFYAKIRQEKSNQPSSS